jgi:hypothetical protein
MTFALFQMALALYPGVVRPAPVWTIFDAYTYIGKATQMSECFVQDCPALKDLRSQVEPSPDPEVNWIRNRQYHRVLYVYHPMHSAILSVLHGICGSWEIAYKVTTVLAEAFLVASITCFLCAVWGAGVAGLGLLLSATLVFPGFHGMHWIVPANTALAIALVTWAAIVASESLGARVWLVFGVTAMIAMHPVGQLYACTSILLYVLMRGRQGRDLLAVGLCIGMICLYLLIARIVSQPALSFWKHPAPADWSYWSGLWSNLAGAWSIVSAWGLRFGGNPIALMLVVVGILAAPAGRRRRVHVVAGVLAGLSLVAVAYVLPRYPAEAFSRVWIPLGLFATGAIGQAVLACVSGLRSAWNFGWCWGTCRARTATPPLVSRDHPIAASAFMALLLVVVAAAHIATGAAVYAARFDAAGSGGRWPLDVEQPTRMLDQAEDHARFVYMDELSMYFYLAHGGLDHGLVYYPAVANSEIEQDWLNAEADIRYVVTMRDIARYQAALRHASARRLGSELLLEENAEIGLRLPQQSAARLVFARFENRGNKASVKLTGRAGGDAFEPTSIAVPGHWCGWLALNLPGEDAPHELTLRQVSGDQPLVLAGVRLGEAHRLNWPWDQEVTLHYRYPHPEVSSRGNPLPAPSPAPAEEEILTFNSAGLIPPMCRSQGVVDDAGIITVIAVRCGHG